MQTDVKWPFLVFIKKNVFCHSENIFPAGGECEVRQCLSQAAAPAHSSRAPQSVICFRWLMISCLVTQVLILHWSPQMADLWIHMSQSYLCSIREIDDTGGGNVLLCKSLYESRENFTFSPGKAGTLITAVTTDNGEECGVLFIRN